MKHNTVYVLEDKPKRVCLGEELQMRKVFFKKLNLLVFFGLVIACAVAIWEYRVNYPNGNRAVASTLSDGERGQGEAQTTDTAGDNGPLKFALHILRENVFELFILGALVALWEHLHQVETAKKIQTTQFAAMRSLLFFIEERKAKEAPLKFKSKGKASNFKEAVDNSLALLSTKSNPEKRDFDFLIKYCKHTALHPMPDEFLFHNLELTLGGLQDLNVDGQYREENEQTPFSQVYKHTRMLEFLNQRLMSVEKASLAEGKSTNRLHIIIGVIDELGHVQTFVNKLSGKKGKKFKIHDAVTARVLHQILLINDDFEIPKMKKSPLASLKLIAKAAVVNLERKSAS